MTPLQQQEVASRGHPVWAEVDLGAIRHNISLIRRHVAPAEVLGVVKGYAYGHGNPASAAAMLEAGATRLGVARVAEALHLRDAGIGAPIHVFTEPPPDAAPALLREDLVATVYTPAFASALSEAALAAGTRAIVHLKVDTGMHRVGVAVADLPDVVRLVQSLRGLELEGAWSHFAVADVPDHPFTLKQLELFLDVTGRIERDGVALRVKHIANSAAALTLPDSRLDMVRCGIAAYGLSPGVQVDHGLDLRPAMSLRARVNMVKQVPAGDAVSYGLQYELARNSNIATVPAGYADGYDRRLSGRAEILLRGRRYRVSGTVCMDQFMVDVGDDEVQTGDVATLLGEDGTERVTAEELAALTGTINYEVTARIPSRVPRVYTQGARDQEVTRRTRVE